MSRRKWAPLLNNKFDWFQLLKEALCLFSRGHITAEIVILCEFTGGQTIKEKANILFKDILCN